MKMYLIDPLKRSVSEIQYEPASLTDINETGKYFPYPAGMADMLSIQLGSEYDVVMHLDKKYESMPVLGDLMLQQEGAWGYYCKNCKTIHSIMGKSLLIGREFRSVEGEEKGHLSDPHTTLEEVRKWVKWASIIHLDPEETQEYLSTGKLPERVDPAQQEVIPADAMVAAAMEMARISTKH